MEYNKKLLIILMQGDKLMEYILLVIGFALLIKGADFFVDGASSIAKILKVPPLLIGLTIVAFGTSAPEAAVSINAAMKGSNEIALGNILGSNIFNLLLAIGITAMIKEIKVQKTTIVKEFPLSLYATLMLFLLSVDVYLGGQKENIISRADGLLLLLGFCVFLFYLVEMAFLSKEENDDFGEHKKHSISKSIIFSIGGIIGIVFGGDIVVKSASTIALTLGMSQTLVGLTIVAIGTSLPELVTSISAAKKGEGDIAMGNIIGSGLFNILFVLGASAAIHPVAISQKLYTDIILLFIITSVVYFFSATGRTIDKKEGLFLTISYVFYMIFR